MSATQRIQQHPLYIQAQTRLAYHVGQLDKEVCFHFSFFCFFITFGLSHSTLAQLNKYPALTQFEKRTQVPKPYIAIGGVALIVILHLVNSLAAPVSNLVGFVIPAFLSFRAIESPSPGDDVQWLTYWIVFAAFNFVESFALRVVLYYFSWYFPVKTLFLLWLQLPAFRVSRHLR